MKYWLTTHWPPRTDDPQPDQHHGVWLQPQHLNVASDMADGDLVFIYESGSGKTVRESYPDGSPKLIPRRPGRQGVVTLARVRDRPSQPEGSRPEHYADGTCRWWKFLAPTEPLNSAGFIPRVELTQALSYATNYAFRGFGTAHSGLASLSEDLFRDLQGRFLASIERRDALTSALLTRGKWGGRGGEGPHHRALKLAIAANPAMLLGEPGLRHWATEHRLPTGDQVDVVLLDEFGRLVVVEVEVDCDQDEVIGPMQCAKYRALMSFLYKRQPSEVRAILVAHTIHRGVEAWCSAYGIQCVTRPRQPVVVRPQPSAS